MTAISLDHYLHIRTAKNSEYALDGNKLILIADYTGVPQVWELDQGEAWPAQLSFTQDRITIVKKVNGSSDLIIGMDTGGNEKQQLFLLKENTNLIDLTNSPEHAHIYGGNSPDGKWIAWSSNCRNPTYLDIYLQNLETKEIHLVYSHNGMFSVVMKTGCDFKVSKD